MSEVLSIIDVNDYGLQQMKSEGGGGEVNLQSKDITINQNGTTSVLPDTGYDGLSDVDVTVSGILDTSDANATSNDIRIDKTAYVNGTKRTGIVPIHKYSGMPMGGRYTDAEQFTPGTFLSSGRYIAVAPAVISGYGGDNFIVDDNKLRVGVPNSMLKSAGGITADKIKVGESIYGVTGTYTSDADATANDILENKTAYVNGNKLTGTLRSIDTSDATATAGDIALGETAYVNGKKVYGGYHNPVFTGDIQQDTSFHVLGDVAITTANYVENTLVNLDTGGNITIKGMKVPQIATLSSLEPHDMDALDDIIPYGQSSWRLNSWGITFLEDVEYQYSNEGYGDYIFSLKFANQNTGKVFKYVAHYDFAGTTSMNLIFAGVLDVSDDQTDYYASSYRRDGETYLNDLRSSGYLVMEGTNWSFPITLLYQPGSSGGSSMFPYKCYAYFMRGYNYTIQMPIRYWAENGQWQ